MKILDLYNKLNVAFQKAPEIKKAFEKSEMLIVVQKLDFGFFPLGSGILIDNKSKIEIAEIDNCKIMVLGNDFGTMHYIDNKCPNNKELKTNPTIRNLLNLELNIKTTFFTNLFIGLRKGKKMVGLKNLQKEYIDFCIDFFKTQLDFIKPKVVLCLGGEVKEALVEYSKDFSEISKTTFTNLYSDKNEDSFVKTVNGIKFIFIPHSSYAHTNWPKNKVKERINKHIKGL